VAAQHILNTAHTVGCAVELASVLTVATILADAAVTPTVSEMTYNVLSGTLNHTQPTNLWPILYNGLNFMHRVCICHKTHYKVVFFCRTRLHEYVNFITDLHVSGLLRHGGSPWRDWTDPCKVPACVWSVPMNLIHE